MLTFSASFVLLIIMAHQAASKSLFKTPTISDFTNRTHEHAAKAVYAKITDYPFMAKLHIRTGSVELQCGGTLIAAKWVLTAAHCITPPGADKIKRIDVCMGTAYMPNIRACVNRRTVKLITRPLSTVDLAMLRLKQPFTITYAIQPLKVVAYDLQHISKNCKVMGWGWMQPGFASPHLLQTDVRLLDYCFEKLICVMAQNHAPCRGDSGGPLICGGILVGVASLGENADCTQNSGITAYVPVWQHNKFITHSIANYAVTTVPKSLSLTAMVISWLWCSIIMKILCTF